MDCLLLLLLAAAAGCSRIGGAPIGQVLDLFVEGGEKHLRTPLRPIRGDTRVVVFAFDGVGDDDLSRAVATGAMPNAAAIMGPAGAGPEVYAHAYAASNAMSVLPTITVAAWTSLGGRAAPGSHARLAADAHEGFLRLRIEDATLRADERFPLAQRLLRLQDADLTSATPGLARPGCGPELITPIRIPQRSRRAGVACFSVAELHRTAARPRELELPSLPRPSSGLG